MMRIRKLLWLLLAGGVSVAAGQQAVPPCTNCAVWNVWQQPFKIYGNTYYVGPHGLASILITSSEGHVLIDGALPESAAQIAANIRALGFRIEDVKLILTTHVHFDHAGGVAQLQRMSGATVVASVWSAAVLRSGGVGSGDPQLGDIRGIEKAGKVRVLKDGETVHVGSIKVTAHATPGHTPGGTSWTWRSCENGRCETVVYVDSVTAVSAPGFKFTHNTQYPELLAQFERSFAFLDSVPCDILLTPHPEASGLWDRLGARNKGVTPDPMIDPSACRRLAAGARVAVQKRIESEGAQ